MPRAPAAVGRLFVLAAHAYPPESQYGTPRADFVRAVAHDLKAADPAAVRAAAAALAPSVPVGATLVPVPGARGSTRENLALAEALARLSGARVLDGLERDPSESQYARRKRGLAPLGASAMRVRWTGERPRGVVALVDNVVTTGATAEAARRALGGDAVLFAWADARGIAGDARGIAQPTDAERRAFSQKARSNPLTQPTGSRSIRREMAYPTKRDELEAAYEVARVSFPGTKEDLLLRKAYEWLGHGFSPSEMRAWMRAKVAFAKSARELDAAGITADLAATETDWGDGPRGTIGHKFEVGDLDLDDALDALDMKPDSEIVVAPRRRSARETGRALMESGRQTGQRFRESISARGRSSLERIRGGISRAGRSAAQRIGGGITRAGNRIARAGTNFSERYPIPNPSGSAMTLQRRPDGRYVASPANAPRRAALRSYHRDIGLLFSRGDHAGAMELIHAGAGPRANPARRKRRYAYEVVAMHGNRVAGRVGTFATLAEANEARRYERMTTRVKRVLI
jgi:hypothetical protein